MLIDSKRLYLIEKMKFLLKICFMVLQHEQFQYLLFMVEILIFV